MCDCMTEKAKKPTVQYLDIISNSLRNEYNIIRSFTKHGPSIGNWNEILIRNFLRKHIPDKFSVGQGFIYRDGKISNQIDVIIYDSHNYSPFFKEGDFIIIEPEAVAVVIEVKTNIQSIKVLNEALQNIESAKKICIEYGTNFEGIIFTYEGYRFDTIISKLSKDCKRVEYQYSPNLIIKLGDYCIIQSIMMFGIEFYKDNDDSLNLFFASILHRLFKRIDADRDYVNKIDVFINEERHRKNAIAFEEIGIGSFIYDPKEVFKLYYEMKERGGLEEN